MISMIGFRRVFVFEESFAYSVLPCWFVYISRAVKKIIISRFSSSGVIFRDYLASVWLHIV